MGLLEGVREHKDTLLRGATLVLGGMALVLVGTLIGLAPGKAVAVTAGLLGVSGVVAMFLGFFLYVLPPLLPPR